MATPAKPVRARRVTVKHPEPVEAFAELKQMDPPCNHCYCQPGEPVGDVPHNRCCKCSDTMEIRGRIDDPRTAEAYMPYILQGPKVAVDNVRYEQPLREGPEPTPTRPDPFQSRPRRFRRKGRIDDDDQGRPRPV